MIFKEKMINLKKTENLRYIVKFVQCAFLIIDGIVLTQDVLSVMMLI